MKRWIACLLCAACLLGYAGLPLPARAEEISGYTLMAENSGISLYVKEDTGEFALRDQAGSWWYSSLPDSLLPDGLTKSQRMNLTSPLILEYTLLNARSDQSERKAIRELGMSVKALPVENGALITYTAGDIAVEIDLLVTLTEDGFQVTIPPDGIREGVGLEAKLERGMGVIRDNMEWVMNTVDELAADPLLARHRNYITRFQRAFMPFVEQMEGIVTAADIRNEVNKAIALLETAQSIFKGGVGELGLFNAIARDEKLDEETKKRCSALYTDMDKRFTQMKMMGQQLTTIKYGAVTALVLLPDFGALTDGQDGYVFYPDGCGAITYSKANHLSHQHYYLEDVYSPDTPDLDSLILDADTGKMPLLMPVFGVKNGGAAFLAVMETGEEYAAVEYYPSSDTLSVHRIGARFRCRRTSGAYDQGNSRGAMFEMERFDTAYSVRYFFLAGEAADYSGMACRYRAYLLDTGRLHVSPLIESDVSVAVNLIMSVSKRSLLGSSLVPVTTFSQAESILSDMSGQGVRGALVNLQGYAAGYSAWTGVGVSAAGALGGEKGIEALAARAEDLGMTLLLENNYTVARESGSPFGNRDFVYSNMGNLASDASRRFFLIKPAAALRCLTERQLPRFEKWAAGGVFFRRSGALLYADYDDRASSTRGGAMESWQTMMRASRESLGVAAADQAGAYAFSFLDWISDAPMEATGYIFTDASVPFYQMVLHGSLLYSGKANNRYYDARYETLKAIEYGMLPVFDITWEKTDKLKDSSCANHFSTSYADWAEAIAQAAQIFADLAPVHSAAMVRHEMLTDTLVRVTYENGAKLLINYGEEAASVDGATVGPMDCLLLQ